MKNFILSYILIIYSFYFIISVKIEKPTEIDLDYITENFENLSQKSNLVQSFTKISNSGNITLMEIFLSKLKEKKIDFNSEYETFYQKKHKTLERIYNRLKYKDEINIKRIAPAFEWAENERFVIMHIKHSALLSSLSCPFVDDEKLVIRKNQQDIHYEAKCILDNSYLFFSLDLKLYSLVTKIQNKEVQRGETRFLINKKKNEEWDGRLLEGGTRLPENSLKMY
jgi:hypothetical protein